MANKPPAVKITGIRGSIPSGYILGRVSAGIGDVELISQGKAQSAGLIPTSLPGPPTGAAGGDLSGTYPNPTVAQLQGRPVAATAPSNLAALLYHTAGATWLPVLLGAVAYTSAYSDLSGVPAIHNVAAGGTTGQVLTKNSNTDYDLTWATPAASSGGGAASIYDDGSNLYVAVSDADGQLVLDGSGDPVFIKEVLPVAAIPAKPKATMQVLTSGSAATYTPTMAATWIKVRMVGGGGGGGGTSTGAVPDGGTGGNGGDTIFNAVHATGGTGANQNVGGDGGDAGTGTANVRFRGGEGHWATNLGTVANAIGGNGGLSIFGGNGQGKPNTRDGQSAKTNSGSGGGGGGAPAASVADAGGGGGAGEGVELILPAAAYVFTVGAKGAGGAAGTGGQKGGDGGEGCIIVEEHYT